MLTLRVRVQPGASRDEVAGWEDGVLRVRLRARAIEGKANEALVSFLAGSMKLRPYQVTIARGERSRDKLVDVDLPDLAEALHRLKLP